MKTRAEILEHLLISNDISIGLKDRTVIKGKLIDVVEDGSILLGIHAVISEAREDDCKNQNICGLYPESEITSINWIETDWTW